MKFLFITSHYYPKPDPNAKRITGLAENLVRKGNSVTVITSSDDFSFREINGVCVYGLKSKGNFSKGKVSRLLNHITFMIKTIRFKREKDIYDFVIATSPSPFNYISGQRLAKKYSAKFVIDIRDIWPDVFVQTGIAKERDLVYRVFNFIAERAYKEADYIFVVTPGKKKRLQNKYPKYAKKIHLVSNGFDEKFLDNNINISFFNKFSKDDLNILYCGNVGIAQDLIPFIDVLEIINDSRIQFHILGKGNRLDYLLNYCSNKTSVNVQYHGLRCEEDVYTALKAADVSYVSLGSDLLDDSIPTKIYESIAMGVPVVLSATGDAVNLINTVGFGKIASSKDLKGLESAIRSVIQEKDKFLDLSEYAKSYVIDNYSRSKITDELLAILQQ
uniref:Glycosyltransferase family 4 protein n=1 Tax=Erysipelothrix rhusiopathiae TaxID=1648 RepID=A0A6S6I149_ERYRH|nr:glycosyltransferase family 4 protein [Erysipelothrix rhusiopathiae]